MRIRLRAGGAFWARRGKQLNQVRISFGILHIKMWHLLRGVLHLTANAALLVSVILARDVLESGVNMFLRTEEAETT